MWSKKAAEHPGRSSGGRWGYYFMEILREAWAGRKHLGTWVWKYIGKEGVQRDGDADRQRGKWRDGEMERQRV